MTTPPIKTKPRGFTTVQEVRIFEESVEKEQKYYKGFPQFQKRLDKCVAITDKITNAGTSKLSFEEFERNFSSSIEEANKTEKSKTHKLKYPITTSQDVGWLIEKEIEKQYIFMKDGGTNRYPRCTPEGDTYHPLSPSKYI